MDNFSLSLGDNITYRWYDLIGYNPEDGRVFNYSAASLSLKIALDWIVLGEIGLDSITSNPLWWIIPMLPVREALAFKLVGGRRDGHLMGDDEVDIEYLRDLIMYAIESRMKGDISGGCKVAGWKYAAATALAYKIRVKWCMDHGVDDVYMFIRSNEPILWDSLDLLAPTGSTIKARETCGTSKGSKASTGAKKRGKGKSEDTQLLFGF